MRHQNSVFHSLLKHIPWAAFDRLVRAAHERHLKVILDFVPNHTSDRHPWFLQSRASRLSSKRDWYIWRDPRSDGGPPNNWISQFGGPAWTIDSATGQYYLHSFLREQPDLNWHNPAVREAMFDILRFWMARGINGFRVDVMWLLLKDDQMRDNPVNPAYEPTQPDIHRTLSVYNADRPEIHALIAQLRGRIVERATRLPFCAFLCPSLWLVFYAGALAN